MKIGYLGPEGSFSHKAAKTFYQNAMYVSYPCFETLFKATVDKDIELAVIPIENTINGAVYIGKERKTQQQSMIYTHNLFAHAECYVPINQHLLVHANNPLLHNASTEEILHQIKYIKSNQNALNQCSRFINELQVMSIAVDSTATAAKNVMQENDYSYAAIASKEAAEIYGLKLIREEIQDEKSNFTRFFLVSPNKANINNAPGYICSIILTASEENILREKLSKIQCHAISNIVFDTNSSTLFRVDIDLCDLEKIPQNILVAIMGVYPQNTAYILSVESTERPRMGLIR